MYCVSLMMTFFASRHVISCSGWPIIVKPSCVHTHLVSFPLVVPRYLNAVENVSSEVHLSLLLSVGRTVHLRHHTLRMLLPRTLDAIQKKIIWNRPMTPV
jgi:hypothetical protein